MVAGMSLRNLTKKFGGKTVVNKVNADFYEGQITALLGHNGAAKTTTLYVIFMYHFLYYTQLCIYLQFHF